MKKNGWIITALAVLLCLGLFALASCGEPVSGGENESAETGASENNGSAPKQSAVVTIGDKKFELKNETELGKLHFPENYVDFNTDRIGNTKSMSYNYDGAFSFEVRVNYEEEHSVDEVKAMLSEYEEQTKEVNGIAYTYYEYKSSLDDDVHYYLVEYDHKPYSIIFFLGENPGNIEEIFMNSVRFE